MTARVRKLAPTSPPGIVIPIPPSESLAHVGTSTMETSPQCGTHVALCVACS